MIQTWEELRRRGEKRRGEERRGGQLSKTDLLRRVDRKIRYMDSVPLRLNRGSESIENKEGLT